LVLQVGGNVDLRDLRAHVVFVDETLHLDQVHQAAEILAGADGPLHGMGVRLEAVAHHVDHVAEVGAHAVHLVHEGDAGNGVAIGLPPDGLGLGLDAGHGAEHGHGAVENAQGALHLDGEVHVPGVSMMLTRYSVSKRFQKAVVAAEVIVMPRSCSCSIQSMVAAPSCTSPTRCRRPV
jgi:hypothetical protein